MDSNSPKKPRRHKKHKLKSLERFANRFPYRFSWLTESRPVSPQSWKVKKNPLKDQLPLQKKLVPTRSIPLPGVASLDFTRPFCFLSPPPHPPLGKLWELKLLNSRFPKQDLHKLPPQARANQRYTSGTSGPSVSFS
ncbi:uncharacterized protein C3orf22 homolog [Acomys russatus]|uniref:uncharacterized protein C3orf22 homolog n=1 Tax=Acomys russatus TaxID=60746 RepID=UPI0021E26092|nr:uncharacterized protein C3orf22 homolog [Acomys russatus]